MLSKTITEVLSNLNVNCIGEDDIQKVLGELSIIAKGTNIESRVAAAIYIALKLKGVSTNIFKVVKAMDIKSDEKMKAVRKTVWTIVSKYMEAKKIVSFTVNPTYDSTHLKISENLRMLGVGDEVIREVISLMDRIKSKYGRQLYCTSGVLAACTYLTLQKSNENLTQKDICEMFKVSRPTLRKWVKKILDIENNALS